MPVLSAGRCGGVPAGGWLPDELGDDGSTAHGDGAGMRAGPWQPGDLCEGGDCGMRLFLRIVRLIALLPSRWDRWSRGLK